MVEIALEISTVEYTTKWCKAQEGGGWEGGPYDMNHLRIVAQVQASSAARKWCNWFTPSCPPANPPPLEAGEEELGLSATLRLESDCGIFCQHGRVFHCSDSVEEVPC